MDGIITFCQLSSHVRPDLTEITTSVSASAHPHRPLIWPRMVAHWPNDHERQATVIFQDTVLWCEIALERRAARQIKMRPYARILVLIATVTGI
jgi:hypothetical protein